MINKRWWEMTGLNAAQEITATINTIAKNEINRRNQYCDSAILYDATQFSHLHVYGSSRSYSNAIALNSAKGMNLASSMTDTLVSRMLANKPRAMYLTNGATYKMQRQAQKLSDFTDGVGYENNVYQLGHQMLKDACMFGTGVCKVVNVGNRVKYERVLIPELFVDDIEAQYGCPRQMHQGRHVDRRMLMEMFPDLADKIQTATPGKSHGLTLMKTVGDTVYLRESWHLPSGPDAEDGKHVLSLEDLILVDEAYTKDYFPFATLHYQPPVIGWHGKGLIERIQRFQIELNMLRWVVQQSTKLAGSFKLFIKNGSKVSPDQISNRLGSIIQGEEPPVWLTPPIVQPEIYSQIQQVTQDAYSQEGISQLSAQSQKPAGLDSGLALTTYDNLSQDRTLSFGQAYEQWFLDISKLAILTAQDIAETEGSYKVDVPDKRFFKSIDWSEIHLDQDEFIMKAYPVSELAEEPALRLQQVTQYMQAGILSIRQGRRLLNFPDLEASDSLADSPEDNLHRILDLIVDDGDYNPPADYYDLQLAQELVLLYLNQAECNGLEEERLEMLRRFKDQVNTLLAPAQASQQTNTNAPQAVPTAPPVSQLLPNAPAQGN